MARKPRPLGSVNSLEKSLLVVTLSLVTIGVMVVGSAAAPQATALGLSTLSFVARDLVYVGLGLLGYVVAARLPLSTLVKSSYPLFLLSVALLGVVALRGSSSYGGQRWIAVGSFTIQPRRVSSWPRVSSWLSS
jgi:cell division protein FtsW